MNWILCGFKSCGKTYFGSRLGLPFLDTDQLIEKRVGMTIPEFVLKKGIEAFRQNEREVISTIEVKDHLIASGGGSVLDPNNLEKFRKLGKLIHLKGSKEIVKRRILSPPLPTFISDEASFEEIYSTRITEYEKIASYSIGLEGKTNGEVLEELWRVINLDRSFGSQHGENPMARPSVS